MMFKKSFASCLTFATLAVILVWSTTLIADATTSSTTNNANATTITNNAITAATTVYTPSPTATDMTRVQLLNALLGYQSSIIVQNAAVSPPGDPYADASTQPAPIYTSIPTIETDVTTVLKSQSLDENLFYLYGVSLIEPPELSSVPLKTSYLSKHFSAYCTPKSSDENAAYVCNNSADSALQHADIEPISLLGPSRYDTAGATAALEYIRSTIDPWSENNIQSVMSNSSDSSNQNKIVKALSRQSKLNVPIYAMLSAYSKRIPSAANPDNKTFMETLEYETSKRYPDLTWHQNISTASADAVLKDIAAMMALSLWMQKEQFKQNERLELLLSMGVVGNIRMNDSYESSQEQGAAAATAAQQTSIDEQNPSEE